MSKHKKSKTKGRKLSASELKNSIFRLFKATPRKRYNAKQVINKLKIDNNRDSVETALEKLAEHNQIIQLSSNNKYKFNVNAAPNGEKPRTEIGIMDMTQSGAGFVVSENLPDNDIYIHQKNLNGALDGDTVKVTYEKRPGRNRAEGKVIEIIERGAEHFIGTLNLSTNYGFVVPDKINMSTDIYVPLEDIRDAKNGDKVVVKVIKWNNKKQKSPIGKITEVLGKPGSNDVEMKAILIQNGFELSFPEEVIEQSEALGEEMDAREIEKRKNFRDVTTFTIDPDTAKDFDDALSIQYLENGHCEIGIHIADVTHYVQPETPLDKEAYKRSTSVYLVDRVLPMLPEKLSNGLCSLRPNEDKFTFSAVFTFDKNDKIVKEWFGKTIIHSDRRFTYNEAQECIDTGEGDFAAEIRVLNRIAHKLRKQRYKEGSISFESPEVKFKLDDDGTPTELYVKERKDAHTLVEDFMLLANKRVAAFVGKPREGMAKIPFVYRVHDTPDFGKVEDFLKFASALGYKVNIQTPEQIAAAFNGLLEAAKENPELAVLAPLAIRTMAKAEYSPENIGHYGLGFSYYTHFTSPIRRYSDVMVHRLLEKNLNIRNPYRAKEDLLAEQCKHISRQERKATDAERQSIKYKQVEYMEKHIGSVFTGIVNGFSERGIFIEMKENLCEGMIQTDTLFDTFVLEESRLSMKGRQTGFVIKMGDAIKVKVVSTNLQKRQINLELEE